MKSNLIFSTMAALLLSAAATAHAEPTAAVAHTGTAVSGQEDVSQINGQLVEVGDHNRYRRTYRKINVSANPVGMIVGVYGVSASYAMHPNFALRADFNYYAPLGEDEQGVEVGVGLPVYFRKVYSGLFLEPGLMVRQISDNSSDASTTQFGPQVLVGQHWYWDSGLNLAVAAGLGRNFNTNQESEEFSDDEEIFFNGYVRFGYAF